MPAESIGERQQRHAVVLTRRWRGGHDNSSGGDAPRQFGLCTANSRGLAEAARRAGHERGPAFDVLRRVEGRRVAGHGCAVSLCFTASAE